MRWVLSLIVLAAVQGFAPARAQTSITLDASPVPIVDAQINGRPVRLEVDMRMPSALMLSRAAAERIGVRRVPLLAVRVNIEGGGSMSGRLARPRLVFEGGDSRAFAGIFPVPVTSRADGVIGPGALPYDVVTIRLGPDLPGMRDIVLPLSDANVWTPQSQAGGQSVRISFDVSQPATVFNRAAARRYDASGGIVSNGELAERPVILGLRTMMQPVRTELTVEGLGIATAYARTAAPLLGADEPDAIVVEREAEGLPPTISLGRETLSRCSTISVDNRSKRLTLRCA
jgi:hypothetical protein